MLTRVADGHIHFRLIVGILQVIILIDAMSNKVYLGLRIVVLVTRPFLPKNYEVLTSLK